MSGLSSTPDLIISLLLGAIGAGYFLYGRKQSNLVSMLSGVGLMLFPMFVSNPWIMAGVGVVLLVLPFKVSL
ncbi:MAG: hypothetical protein P8Y64_07990 [Gammaproteobacteria bacterium]|jgi:hypothetical protein